MIYRTEHVRYPLKKFRLTALLTCRIIFKLGNVDFEGKLVLTDFATKFWAIYFGSETKLHTNIHTKIRDIFIYFSHIGIITSFNT